VSAGSAKDWQPGGRVSFLSIKVTDDWHLWMDATRNQRTITAPAAKAGVGYWSGRDVRVEFRPAAANTGIVFVGADLSGCPRIPATIENRVDAQRRTTLRRGEAAVEMVEHIMAALAGLQVDNCEIWVDQPEMPGCDGSSLPFVEALQSAGIVEQDTARPRQRIDRIVRLGDESSWIEARPCRSNKMVLRYELDYGSGNPIGRQSLEISLSPRHFHMNLAPSRTFVLEAEAEAIKAQGLGCRTGFKDLLVFGQRGPIDNQLRFPDECVRHKMLDLVGDLALAGCDLIGRFTAFRSGHRLNAELVRTIAAERDNHKIQKRCA
jgi:UDP-3-O-[3-hydroxymyristoyl] N-acetylglucosamine deacetylase